MPTVTITMPAPLVEAVDRAAEAEGKSRSAFLAAAAERALEGRGMWPPGQIPPGSKVLVQFPAPPVRSVDVEVGIGPMPLQPEQGTRARPAPSAFTRIDPETGEVVEVRRG